MSDSVICNWTTKYEILTQFLSFSQRKVPDYESMFSTLAHYPWYTLDLDSADPVPAFVDRRWHGYRDERKEALHQLAG